MYTPLHLTPNNTEISLYKYIPTRYALKVIKDNKLRWSSPTKFNDPVDVVRKLRLEDRAVEIQEALLQELAMLIIAGVCPPQIKHPKLKYILQHMQNLDPQKRQEAARDLKRHGLISPTGQQISSLRFMSEEWEKMVGQMRILSLSESHAVIPMWAHYSDNGRGVALEFRGDRKRDSVFLAAKKVKYSNTPPSIVSVSDWVQSLIGSGEKGWEYLFGEAQYVKTEEWKYEKEWRIVTFDYDTVDYSYFNFFPEDLRGIYFGYNCDSVSKIEILKTLDSRYSHVKIYNSEFAQIERVLCFSEANRDSWR